jgi:hypothetical protein
MSAITSNSVFSPSSMGAISEEAKGKKSGGGKGGSKPGGSKPKGSKTEGSKPKNEPKKPFMIKGPIPPKEFRDPDIIYAETNPPGLPPGQRPWDKKENNSLQSEEAAIKTVMSWKSPSVYSAYAKNARGSSSGGSGLKTYDGGKVMAVGSSSNTGSKDLAVCSTGTKDSCTIS